MFGNAAASDAASLDMVQSLPTVRGSKGFTIGLGGDMKDENCARKQLYNFRTACLGEVYSGSVLGAGREIYQPLQRLMWPLQPLHHFIFQFIFQSRVVPGDVLEIYSKDVATCVCVSHINCGHSFRSCSGTLVSLNTHH